LDDLPEGEIALDLVAKTRRLSLATNYRLKEHGAIALDGLNRRRRTAVGGDVELSASGLLNGHIRGEVGDLAPIGAFFDRNCSGAATLDLSFAPAKRPGHRRQHRSPQSSVVMDDGTPPRRSGSRSAAGSTMPSEIPRARRSCASPRRGSGRVSLTQAVLNGTGNAGALKICLQAEGKQGRSVALDADGVLALAVAEQRLRLDHLEGSSGPLARASTRLPVSPAMPAHCLAGLDAAIGDIRLTGGGRIGQKQVDLRLSVRELPIEAPRRSRSNPMSPARSPISNSPVRLRPRRRIGRCASPVSASAKRKSRRSPASRGRPGSICRAAAARCPPTRGSPDVAIDGQARRRSPFACSRSCSTSPLTRRPG
jgi:hypothetical protein